MTIEATASHTIAPVISLSQIPRAAMPRDTRAAVSSNTTVGTVGSRLSRQNPRRLLRPLAEARARHATTSELDSKMKRAHQHGIGPPARALVRTAVQQLAHALPD